MSTKRRGSGHRGTEAKRDAAIEAQAVKVVAWTRLMYPLAIAVAVAVVLLAFKPIAHEMTNSINSISGKETDFNVGFAINIAMTITVGGAGLVAYFNQRGRLRSQRELIKKYEKLLGIEDDEQQL